MNHKDSVPDGIRDLLKTFNKIEINIESTEEAFKEYYQNRCDTIEDDVKALLSKYDIQPILNDNQWQKVVIRVFKGEKEGYKIIGVRAYAQIEKPQKWYAVFAPKNDCWTVDESTSELVKLEKVPTREEFNCTFCGLCGDVVTLCSSEMEIEEFFYMF